MSYTAPTWNNANFSGVGGIYSPLPYPLQFGFVPTARVWPGAAVGAAGKSFAAAAANVVAGATLDFQHPIRAVSIGAGATASFQTSILPMAISAGAAANLVGASSTKTTATVAAGTTFSPQLINPQQRAFAVSAGCTPALASGALIASRFIASAGAASDFHGAQNKPVRAVVRAGATPRFKGGYRQSATYAMAVGAAVSPKMARLFGGAFTASPQAVLSMMPWTAEPRTVALAAGTQFLPVAIAAGSAEFHVSVGTVVAGVSSYSTAAPTPDLDPEIPQFVIFTAVSQSAVLS